MDPLEVVRSVLNHVNDGTLEEQAHGLLDPEVVLVDGTGQEHRGLDNYVAAIRRFREAMPDTQRELLDHEVNGDTVNITMRASGTFTGTMRTPDGVMIAGNGNRAEWQVRVETKLKNGKIARWTVTFDMQDFMSQLGLG